MKLLLDFLPILLFFATFRWADANAQRAAGWVNDYLGPLVSGGSVGAKEAPIILATVVVIAATMLQVVVLKLRRRKVDTMLWVSLGLVTVMGSLTLWLHDETFIKWKPTLLYWVMAVVFGTSASLFKRNLIQAVMGEHAAAPPEVWRRLNWAWVIFFLCMGALNLFVAYRFDTSTWVSFKLFGGLGLMLTFTVAQAFYLGRYLREDGQ